MNRVRCLEMKCIDKVSFHLVVESFICENIRSESKMILHDVNLNSFDVLAARM